MTLKEQLLQEIEQAPDSLLEKLLILCRQDKGEEDSSHCSGDRASSDRVVAQMDAVRQLQEKMRETIPPGRSLVDELIGDRRLEAENE